MNLGIVIFVFWYAFVKEILAYIIFRNDFILLRCCWKLIF